MSETLERLRTLRAQAGKSAVLPRPAMTVSTPVRTSRPDATQTVADLRRLLRVRAPAGLTRTAIDADRVLPGDEIAPGLRLIEATLPCDPVAQQLCGAFDRREAMIPTSDVNRTLIDTAISFSTSVLTFCSLPSVSPLRWSSNVEYGRSSECRMPSA